MEQTNQLADLIMAIIQSKVDERIEQKVADLQDGVNTVAFDIYEHSDAIANIVEDIDIDHKISDYFGNNTFSVTVD